MSTSPPSDVMTLAGLALANGPWLAVRLGRLAEHAGHPLPAAIIEGAVLGSSRVLAQVLNDEGRPAANADHETDPAAILGREQAQAHQQAGLDMPGSLRSLRLLRRAYDDLVRESWVDKDSRGRAHEDVERFFERMLIGHFLTWAGSVAASAPAPAADNGELSGLLAQREDELRRAMDAARQATAALRQSRERVNALAGELAQAQAWGKTQLEAQEALKAELDAAREAARTGAEAGGTAALKAEFAAAQEQSKARQAALSANIKALEDRLAEAQSALAAQREVEEAREMALKEIDSARAEAEASREALRQAQEAAQTAVARAEAQTLLARREAEEAREQAQRDVKAAQEELRRAREGHATLVSEAEAMRARLAETGSRLTEVRRSEEAEIQARLAQAASALTQSQERVAVLEAEQRVAQQNIEGLSVRLAEQESLHSFKDERLREQSRTVIESQELLVRLGATKDEIAARAQAAEAECAGLTAELARLRQELAAASVQRDEQSGSAQSLAAERDSLAARLVQTANALDAATRQAQDATSAYDATVGLLSTHLNLTADAVAAVDAGGVVTAWNPRFPELFGLTEADRAGGLTAILPRLAARLQRPEDFLARVGELIADAALSEQGLVLATITGQTLVFGCHSTTASGTAPGTAPGGATGRLFNFRDVSLERDMENLVREIESITRYELGQSLMAFIHLPEELLGDPAVTPEQAAKLTIIRDSGFRIVNTVNMAVDIFRMERGLYQMPPGRSLDLAVVARRAAKDVGQLAVSRHIELELMLGGSPLPGDASLPGPGDPIPAHALALNLLRDALEAAPRQSSVQAALSTDEAAKVLCLDITRPGTLGPDEQARFFDKPVGADNGDGLARARYAARLIASSFGGSLSVSASPETTTLSLRLPKA